MGGLAGCYSHHPGDCCPDFTGPLFLPPSWRSRRRRMWVKRLSWHQFFLKSNGFTSTNTRPHLCLVPPLLLRTANGCTCTGLLHHFLWHSGTNMFTPPYIYAQFLIGESLGLWPAARDQITQRGRVPKHIKYACESTVKVNKALWSKITVSSQCPYISPVSCGTVKQQMRTGTITSCWLSNISHVSSITSVTEFSYPAEDTVCHF